MWGYLGYTLLYSIPIAGIICPLVFSFAVSKNINARNYARSCGVIDLLQLITFTVTLVFIFILFDSLLAVLQ